MTYETKSSKGYDGWQATSEAEIGQTAEGPRILKLRTAKARGGLAASASVCIRKNAAQAGFMCETMSNDLVTARLPLKIKIDGGLIQSVTDADGHMIECEVWDKDTEGVDLDSPQLKTDEDGDEFYIYYP